MNMHGVAAVLRSLRVVCHQFGWGMPASTRWQTIQSGPQGGLGQLGEAAPDHARCSGDRLSVCPRLLGSAVALPPPVAVSACK